MRDRQRRRAVIAPARHQHARAAISTSDGDEPAQHDRVDARAAVMAPNGTATAAATRSAAPRASVHCAQRRGTANGDAPTKSISSSVHGGDARIVDRGHQRHVDQRRAEAGEAAHQRPPARRSPAPRRKRRIGEGGGEGRAVGKFDHGVGRGFALAGTACALAAMPSGLRPLGLIAGRALSTGRPWDARFASSASIRGSAAPAGAWSRSTATG